MNFAQKKVLFIISVLVAFFCLVSNSTYGPILALLPVFPMIIKGVDLNLFHGSILSIYWISFSLLICCPLYWLAESISLSRYYFLVVYTPILIVFYKQPHQPATRTFLILETIFWDWPLLIWMHLYAYFGLTALKPMYSQINNLFAIGSLPIGDRDAQFLHDRGVRVVVNLCREAEGPLDAYSRFNIIQIRLPTPGNFFDYNCSLIELIDYLSEAKDSITFNLSSSFVCFLHLCEPSYSDVLKGIRFIASHVAKDGDTKVFVHCKAGRGRSALFVLCYMLLMSDLSIGEIFNQLKDRRPLVESHILQARVLQQFIDNSKKYGRDLDAY